jgi:hypothetical protein
MNAAARGEVPLRRFITFFKTGDIRIHLFDFIKKSWGENGSRIGVIVTTIQITSLP